MKKVLALVLCFVLALSGVATALATGAEGSPAPSGQPANTQTPAASEEPDALANPVQSAGPAASPEVDPSAQPDVSPNPSASVDPDVSPNPSASVDPDVSPNPSASVDPDVSPNPSASVDPSVSPNPSASVDPSVSPNPSATPVPGGLIVDGGAFTVQAAYEHLLTLQSLEEIEAYLAKLTPEQLAALEAMPEDQLAQLEAHLQSLQPEPELPQTVTFTDAGPLMPAVRVSAVRMFAAARARATGADDGLILAKNVVPDGDGFKITLEAYTTGKVTTTSSATSVDVVLVLDQSGSMAYNFSGNSTSTNADRRQYAMKQAVNQFIAAVAEKYNAASADHRMAIVTFGSNASVLQPWTTVDAAGKNTLTGKINGLPNSPSGATNVGAGMAQAETLMGSGYNYTGSNTNRQKVVIVFTDGVPTTSDTFSISVANTAIASAKKLKDSGATVYSIGIFTGSNPAELNGSEYVRAVISNIPCNGDEGTFWGGTNIASIFTGDVRNIDIPAGNRFLNFLSTNFPSATEIGITNDYDFPGLAGGDGWYITKNFDRINNDYYLTADNATALDNIFKTISEQIGSADIALNTETTVVRDEVTPYFTVPANAGDIAVYTQDRTAAGGWADRQSAAGVTPSVSGNMVSVTGFDFNANYVSEVPHPDTNFYGRKLVIEFTVQARDGFWGGNQIPTNVEETSGVFDSTSQYSKNFPVPTPVDVPIRLPGFEGKTAGVYYSGSVPTVSKTDTALYTPIPIPTGADAWQVEYVDVRTLAYALEDGQTISNTEDGEYAITASIQSKYVNAQGQLTTGTSEANPKGRVEIYKPEIAFKDSEIYLGETADYETQNVDGTPVWKHGDTLSTASAVTMFGEAPALTFACDPQEDAFETETTVQVTVQNGAQDITGVTTFVNAAHTPTAHAGTDPLHEFTVRIKTCTLTITKTGTYYDNQSSRAGGGSATDSFIFTVKGGNDNELCSGIDLKVAVQAGGSVTIADLPVGTYTVTEDGGWSWRYEVTGNTGPVTLSRDNANGTVTVTNTVSNSKWLSGDNFIVNLFNRLIAAN
jgi:uncharacterized protein YegL